jgi:hypothetical protein
VNPVVSTDIVWADSLRGRVCLTDRSNFGTAIFDGINNVFAGRITGFVGSNGIVGTAGRTG